MNYETGIRTAEGLRPPEAQSASAFRARVSHLAADDRVHHLGGGNVVLGDRHDVLREDDDVGQLAGSKRALQVLLEGRVGGSRQV